MQPTVFEYFDIEQLSTRQLHKIYQLRQEVFIVEQDCVYQDCDDIDLAAKHVLGLTDKQFSSYCRIYTDGRSVHIGRVLVSKSFRHQGIARLMMTRVIEFIGTYYPNYQFVALSAQSYLIPFYASFGFSSIGDAHVEDGIPHQNMERKLAGIS